MPDARAPALLDLLRTLPQAPVIPEAAAHAWAHAAQDLEPAHAHAQVDALRGFTPFESAVLAYAREGTFHPHSDARSITRSKLLLEPPEPEGDDARRARAIVPIARQAHRQAAEAQGWRVRTDLLDKINAHRDASLPWLAGQVGDILEQDGKLVLVDYQAPTATAFAEMAESGASRTQALALHHLLLLARRAGVDIQGLRVHAFCAQAWRSQDRDVAIDQAKLAAVEQAGSHFWANHVQAGTPAPDVSVGHPQQIDELTLLVDGQEVQVPVIDPAARTESGQPVVLESYTLSADTLPRLRQQVAQLGAEVFGQAMVKAEAERMRDTLTRAIRAALPLKVLPTDTARIDLGPVRLKVDWNYHEDLLLAAARAGLAHMGQGEEEIDLMLDADNFHRPATWSAETLVQVLREKKGIDVATDPDFAPAQSRPRTRRQDTLAALLKDLEKMLPAPVAWEQLVDYEASSLSVEVVRAPTAGFGKQLRTDTLDKVRAALAPLARQVGTEHAAAHREHAASAADLPATPAPARRRRAGV